MGIMIILDPGTIVAQGADEGTVNGLTPLLSSVEMDGRKYKCVPNLSTWQRGDIVLFAGPNTPPTNKNAVKKREIQQNVYDQNINVACWVDVGIYLEDGNYVGAIGNRGGQAGCPQLAVLSLSSRMGSERIRVRRLDSATEAEEAAAGSEIAAFAENAIGSEKSLWEDAIESVKTGLSVRPCQELHELAFSAQFAFQAIGSACDTPMREKAKLPCHLVRFTPPLKDVGVRWCKMKS